MGWGLGANRVHSTSSESKESNPTTSGKVRRPYTMMTHVEEGSTSKKGSIDVEGGGRHGPGEDNIMLGFQNLSISCVDPPEHIVANVSGYVVKGIGKEGSETPLESIDNLGS